MKPYNIFFLFLISTIVFSQVPQDPKVGLVLSGGGAKGMAHVGVLKEIERAGVRIDYIGGTSMGAIVGGLYACGYSADQLEKILLETDLNDIINDNYDRDAKSFNDKEDGERYALTFPIVKGKIQFPLSISKGQNIYNLLVQLTHNQRNVEDFRTLPIPFYCVATDINTGDKIILEEGFLPLAINASSALPTLFSPVTIGEHSLMDGGISDNYPIDEMLNKGMDFIIGVNTQLETASIEEEVTTFSEVLIRVGSIQAEKILAPKVEKTDIYIHPNLQEYSLLSFSDKKAIIDKGERAGRDVFEQLVQIAEQQSPRERISQKIPSSFQLDVLSLPKTESYKHNYFTGKIRLKPNAQHSFEKLKEGMTNLAATQNFKPFRYTLRDQNGQETLQFDLRESSNKLLFRTGIHYNDLMGIGALLNLTHKRALLNNAEASLDLILGEYFRYAFSYFIDKGAFWSIGIRSTLDQFETKAPLRVQNQSDYSVFEATRTHVYTLKNTFYLQTLFREEMVLGTGISHQRNTLKTNLFDGQKGQFLYVDNADYFSVEGYLKIDTRDKAIFSKKGGFFNGSIAYYFNHKTEETAVVFEPFIIGIAEMGTTFSFSNKWVAFFNTSGGFTVGTPNTSTFDFILGGYGNKPVLHYQPFVGLPQQHTGGDSFVKADMILDHEFMPHHHARLFVQAGIIEDDIFMTRQWAKKPDYFGVGLAYGLETFAGPVELTSAYSPQYNRMVYHVNFGWRF